MHSNSAYSNYGLLSPKSVMLFLLSLAFVLEACHATECVHFGSLSVESGASCELSLGAYSYTDVTIEDGATLNIGAGKR